MIIVFLPDEAADAASDCWLFSRRANRDLII
jgi:hypothetical protein